MEDIPPPYESINANVLDLLPPYLSTASLVKLCLVSRSYYTSFIPYLWGSPASHFVEVATESVRTTNGINFANLQVSGSQNDMVYVALTRFKRILRRARLSTRSLCHTLHLPPAHPEIYGGPNSTWLREVLDWLPNLQSLCVSGLPFFDHDSLVAVDQSRTSSVPVTPNDEDFRRYPVKLLLAAKEPNVTWVGLSLLMPHLPNLVYLDLSYTSPARNTNVLRSLDALVDLQVLKLRGISLRDNELEVLANVIGLRVRLLDIAENQLSDMGTSNGRMHNDQYSRRHLESWPVGLPPPPDSLSLDTTRTVELDEALLNQLTHPLTGRLAFEDMPHGGITHLYIGGNPNVTIESIRSILDLGRLHVLDAGDIAALTPVDLHMLAVQRKSGQSRDMARAKSISTNNNNFRSLIKRHKSRPSSMQSSECGSIQEEQGTVGAEDFLRLPGAEKLLPVLHEKASKNLTHFRIDHAAVTAVLDPAKELKEKEKAASDKIELPDELSRGAELDSATRDVHEAPGTRAYAAEMPAGNAVFEMDATPAAPRAELPGDLIHFAISSSIGDMPEPSIEEVATPIRGDGAMAPEVVEPTGYDLKSEDDNGEEVVLDATGSGIKREVTSSSASTVSTLQTQTSVPAHQERADKPKPLEIRKNTAPRPRAGSETTTAHRAQIDNLMSLRPRKPITKLHPSFLPNLRTFVLTNLPARVYASSSIIENLKAFITACAAETRLALLKVRTDYSLPPGRARQQAERQHASTLFALRTLVLEVNTEPDPGQQRGWKHTGQRLDISKSSTGDRDSEALWSAAENDFSFFGEEGEETAECGIYDQEPDKYYPTISFDDKIVVTSNDRPHDHNSSHSMNTPRLSSPTVGYGSSASTLRPTSPPMRNGTTLSSPRNLPLGRNRRTSNDMQRGTPSPTTSAFRPPSRSSDASSPYFEVHGSYPTPRAQRPSSNPSPLPPVTAEPPPLLDVVAELAKWRRERKATYESARRASSASVSAGSRLAEMEPYVEGYWSGEVKIVRNAMKAWKGKMERQGDFDIYGNYFEGGYLYP
ncbi:hypothetical protein LTR70_004984 [Exophiala xenobiotica]|uniref:Uncharacterized protein n=1 Tax=Lithohypha guttulata TaxID=1690604 RepID=A0ABR0KBZ1_9EURO|nr:hypothetical protein LTR24_004387 [Lithohypha guttulata]KAK5319365.1 hypothetical protein LTR70_004984 [Exophiala xenobiotica]